jgi:hypothetical protein
MKPKLARGPSSRKAKVPPIQSEKPSSPRDDDSAYPPSLDSNHDDFGNIKDVSIENCLPFMWWRNIWKIKLLKKPHLILLREIGPRLSLLWPRLLDILGTGMQRNAPLENAFCPPGTAECACAALRNKDGGRP